MPQNIPIRLIHSDSTITQIMATDVALDVERKTGGIPIIFAGSTRGGFDLNLNNATIIINGIIADDDMISTISNATKASASIDFSVSHSTAKYSDIEAASWINAGIADDMTLYGGRVTASNTEDAQYYITLKDTAGTEYEIAFVSNAGAVANHQGIDTGPNPDRYYIGVYNHSGSVAGTHVEIADNLFDLINNDSILQTKFTATKETSPTTGEANTQIRITQDTAGSFHNTIGVSPMSQGAWRNKGTKIPNISKFTGGRGSGGTDKARSAGDRVMDLYGILNNSDNATLASRLKHKDNWRGTFGNSGVAGEASSGNQFGDYIIGIQIPFNSMRKAEGDEKYSVRNFFMPTGASHMAWAKGSDNSRPATDSFEPETNERDFTGIKGTVQKATFTQQGGEPIYSFTIIFAPIDLIW
jgi:hypothetical protein